MNTALQILALIIHLEGGYMPLDSFNIYDSRRVTDQQKTYLDIGVDFLFFNLVFIGGEVRTDIAISNDEELRFYPFIANYCFRFGMRINDNIEIGFRHFCIHPITPNVISVPVNLHYEGAYEEIYIKIDVKINLL